MVVWIHRNCRLVYKISRSMIPALKPIISGEGKVHIP